MQAFVRRKTVEAMEARKLAIITGLYANTNLDDQKGTRAKIINELEEQFSNAIAEVYDPTPEIDLHGNPFFDAMKIAGEELTEEEINSTVGTRSSVRYLPNYEDVDQVAE